MDVEFQKKSEKFQGVLGAFKLASAKFHETLGHLRILANVLGPFQGT